MGVVMQQQVNHVSHVCFVFRPENLTAAMQEFGKAFGITEWDGPTEIPEFGILLAQAVSEGVELLAPVRDDNIFAEHLKAKGEGFFAMTFGVADVRAAAEKARRAGIEMHEDEQGAPFIIDGMTAVNGGPAHPSWASKLRRYEEVSLKPVCGLNFYLGQIEPL